MLNTTKSAAFKVSAPLPGGIGAGGGVSGTSGRTEEMLERLRRSKANYFQERVRESSASTPIVTKGSASTQMDDARFPRNFRFRARDGEMLVLAIKQDAKTRRFPAA